MKTEKDKNVLQSHVFLVVGGLLVVILLLLVPNALLLRYENEPLSSNRVAEILGTAFFCWLVLLVVIRVRNFFWVALPFLWVMPLEALYIILYGRTSDAHIFGILSDTTFDEAYQYVKKYLIYIVVYLVGVTWGVFFFSVLAKNNKIKIPTRIGGIILAGAAVLCVGVGLGEYLLSSQTNRVTKASTHESLLFSTNHGVAELAFIEVFPFGLLVRYSDYQQQVKQMNILRENIKNFKFDAKPSDYQGREIYVLVIGETARSKNLSINGYQKETTPLLSAQKNIISFSNMVTGWAWTRMSVPVILTRKKSTNRDISFPEKSIVTLFSEAGFKTYWVSMQSPYGFHDSPIALHSREADSVQFLNPIDYKGAGFYDDAMLPSLKNAVITGEKLFIVLHMLGSHFNYADRYPKEFDFFQPSVKQKNVALQDESEKARLLNSYDNSLRFTDYFLNQVIEVVKSQNAVSSVFYVSDHGELIFDDGCNKSGHGHQTEYDHMNASILWLSDQYIAKKSENYRYVSSKKTAPLSTENVFHSLAGMAHISYFGEDHTLDIFSNLWQPHARVLQNGVNFDDSEKGGVCKEIVHKK